MKKIALPAALCSCVLIISGCAATPAPATVQATPATTSAAEPATSTTPKSDAPVATVATQQAPATPAPAAPVITSPEVVSPPIGAIMPAVTCMNLQVAQDTIQAAGVFFSRSDDATGRGRNQVIDSNWVVVSQTPVAGSPFGEGDAVLSAVKIGEPGDCS